MKTRKHTATPSSPTRPSDNGGFTLIEMLVVMLVIALLLAIGIPIVIEIRTQAKIQTCQARVNQISVAVEGYHGVHKNYPDVNEMAFKLIGQSFTEDASGVRTEVPDNHPGPGYRIKPRGKLYPPWNGVDELKTTGDHVVDATNTNLVYFLDAFGRPIWYCPLKNGVYTDIDFATSDTEDGSTITIDNYAKNSDGRYFRTDFIVMSQSANGKWGRFSDLNPAEPTDDVTNFLD